MINGSKKTITINQGGTAKAIEVKIPKGLTEGKKIRLAGKGEISPNGGPAGNLYLKASPVATSEYSIEGNNILMPKSVKLTQALLGDKIEIATQALLGDKIEIATPDGTSINLKLPAGIKHNAKMRVPRHGIPHIKGDGCGDLFVEINIEMPKKQTEKQKEIIAQLKKTGL